MKVEFVETVVGGATATCWSAAVAIGFDGAAVGRERPPLEAVVVWSGPKRPSSSSSDIDGSLSVSLDVVPRDSVGGATCGP